ncbi:MULTISPECIES: hypothetical protein [Enterobacter cloacae complex]|mgnify:CR=1 FL=1|uniref:hypothetical protein n=1 Tax=Enterobacter cloacae complex TaxID=354276 RepID=UPI0012556385|nr:hypothetical protein [Enterobacter hormaechei]HCM9300276.1 hypothetical protein [Enterobacter hormaechei subsp. xiangfangensis]MBD8848813.1 hypothetical protein [Enterobacter hormaechei]MDP5224800.1 hypothetical protein [Enterobacter hormaechei]QLO98684.1 hypothetical protein HV047_13880 [Enterobacter hormaechei]VAG12076.1 Uncharacterised protein [Enterobacter hormaechei]
MAKFYPRISTFLSGCWAFISSFSLTSVIIGRTAFALRRVVEHVISAFAMKIAPEKADWRVVERMCSESVREKINVFGRHPRNTGALCSPLL